jgi:hypothetical protein
MLPLYDRLTGKVSAKKKIGKKQENDKLRTYS